MARGRYFAIVWPPADAEAVERIEAISAQVAGDAGWRRVHQGDGLRVWVDAAVGLPVTPLPDGAGVVVGPTWPMPGAALAINPTGAGRQKVAAAFTAVRWGRYVAILSDRGSGATSVLRDPSGLLEALTWRTRDGDQVVSSDPFGLPDGLRPPWPSLNWDRITAYVGLLSAATTEPLFDGMTAIGPGELHDLASGGAELIWRPSAFAAAPADTADGIAEELLRRVDACTAALVEPHTKVLMALSGGLDSSIVAASLVAVGAGPKVACWLNRAGDRRDGDERAYARAVTDRLGMPLTAVAKPLTPLEPQDFAEIGRFLWPAINAVDPARDRDEVARLRSQHATGLVSGDGGDAVFLQAPHAAIWDDLYGRERLRALFSPVLADVARRSRQSVWQVLAQAHALRRGRAKPTMTPSRFATRRVRETVQANRHRWVAEAHEAGVPAGKRLQIQAIANCQVFRGESRRAREADLIFPLLAQPVVELCLRIPTPLLAGAAYDRAFARSAFADRLPPEVRDRRGKGNLAGYFSRLVAASLPTLRPYLIEGCLAEARVLDRDRLNAALDPAQLLYGTRGNELLILCAVEAWVRYWQTRMPDTLGAARRV